MSRNFSNRSSIRASAGLQAPLQVLAARLARSQQRRGGFSLIEVVIALAIFVFGALAIVRIFPGSLSVVQNSEQRAVGQRMAQTALAGYNSKPFTVPAAIIDSDPAFFTANSNADLAAWSDFPGAVFGTPNDDNLSLSTAPPVTDDNAQVNSAFRQSAMGRFRRIVGETYRVPASGEVLTRFPYVYTQAYNAANSVLLKTRYDVDGVTVDQTGALDFTNASIAGDTAAFNDPANPNRPPVTDTRFRNPNFTGTDRINTTFYVSYNWTNADGRLNRVADEPKKFPDNTGWVGTPANVAQASGTNILAGPVRVWFYAIDAATTAQQGTANYDSNVGRLQLPTLAGQTISIDYTVPDWRFLVTDTNLTTRLNTSDLDYLTERGITAAEPRQVGVPTRYITDEAIGPSPATAPSQVYTLLRGLNPAATPLPASLSDWSPDKYAPTQPPANGEPSYMATSGTASYRAVAVKPKSGQVFFDIQDTTSNTPLISPFARVVYRNVDGWTQQVSLPSRSYVPFVAGANRDLFPREPWREYISLPAPDNRVILHAADAGQSLVASYEYKVGTEFFTMNDVPVTVERRIEDRPTNPGPTAVPAEFNGSYSTASGTTAPSTKVAILYLLDNQGFKIGAPAPEGGSTTGATITAITSIKGASIRARSAWFDGSRYTQTFVAGYRPLDVENYNGG